MSDSTPQSSDAASEPVSERIRARIVKGLECLGLILDPVRNGALTGGACGEFSAEGSTLRAFVIPTDEALMIARDTFRVVSGETVES